MRNCVDAEKTLQLPDCPNLFARSTTLTICAPVDVAAPRAAAGVWMIPRPTLSPVVSDPKRARLRTPSVFATPRTTPAAPLAMVGPAATIRFPEMPRTISGVAATKCSEEAGSTSQSTDLASRSRRRGRAARAAADQGQQVELSVDVAGLGISPADQRSLSAAVQTTRAIIAAHT